MADALLVHLIVSVLFRKRYLHRPTLCIGEGYKYLNQIHCVF